MLQIIAYNERPRYSECGMGLAKNNWKIEARIHQLHQLIRKFNAEKNYVQVERIKKDLKKLQAKVQQQLEFFKRTQNNQIDYFKEKGFKVHGVIMDSRNISICGNSCATWKKQNAKIDKETRSARIEAKKAQKKNSGNLFANLIVRSLITGWANSTKAASSVTAKLHFEFENPKGLSRCRCATALKAHQKMESLSWAIVFDPRDIIRAYSKDVHSHADGRKGRTRKCESPRHKKCEISLDQALLIAQGSYIPKEYPEFFIKPGAKPIGIYISKLNGPWRTTVNELEEYANKKGLKIFHD